MKRDFPLAYSGEVIGLLGGSFDPAHSGHAHITREALKRFGLDRLWWLVSPGNPLKKQGPAPMAERIERAKSVMDHPRVKITDLEQTLGTRYTAQTLAALMARYPGVRFVWLMGADNLAGFHKWRDWDWIMQNVPVGVLARPGDRISARRSVAAQRFDHLRIAGPASHLLGRGPRARWCYINVPLSDASSSEIRASGNW